MVTLSRFPFTLCSFSFQYFLGTIHLPTSPHVLTLTLTHFPSSWSLRHILKYLSTWCFVLTLLSLYRSLSWCFTHPPPFPILSRYIRFLSFLSVPIKSQLYSLSLLTTLFSFSFSFSFSLFLSFCPHLYLVVSQSQFPSLIFSLSLSPVYFPNFQFPVLQFPNRLASPLNTNTCSPSSALSLLFLLSFASTPLFD